MFEAVCSDYDKRSVLSEANLFVFLKDSAAENKLYRKKFLKCSSLQSEVIVSER
jgi:hypothetical protein